MSWTLSLFGRAPVAGRTKTRLIPALGPRGAAQLYAEFVRDVLGHARAARGAELRFWTADGRDGDALDDLLQGTERAVQCEGDLGARMLHALDAGLATCARSVVIGTDAPTLPTSYLDSAADALERADVVLGPSADGGYYLIGARRTHARMFEAARFSTRHAFSDTVRACEAAGLSIVCLAPWYDVDTPHDLSLLRSHLVLRPDAAPHTADWLSLRVAR